MLERLPRDSLAWRPHPKSRSLGEITAHITRLPDLFIGKLTGPEFDHDSYRSPPTDIVAEIVQAFDRSISGAAEQLKALSDEQRLTPWRYRSRERVIFEMPRLAVIRAAALNHVIRRRGHLSVCLRLLGVPLPPVYGPTADEPVD